ncbi:hypothetical protein PROFUN_04728 [Planoprotostelium fungivorum]|uniref:Uncharacterized protein n=1 Tax=Planoprotostelium fungivorum TaxID=1890364 RepID=A0A2P6NG05_9EUKA|nr:hypothetical protein PROFUN_04728 [Planoprotostelium fungivorum]
MSFKKVTLKGEVPSGRSQFGMCSAGGVTYIFGGQRGNEAYNDMYSISHTDWTCTKIQPKGTIPSSRWKCTLTAVDDKLYLFGGETVGAIKTNELHVFDIRVGQMARSGHTCTLIKNELVIYGNDGDSNENPLNALSILSLENMEWRQPSQGGSVPEVRSGHSAITFNGKLIMYGGYGHNTRTALDEVWVYDLGAARWIEIPKRGPRPEPRSGSQAWVSTKYFCVWGGIGPGRQHDWTDLHYADITSSPLTWQKKKPMGVVSPPERYSHGVSIVDDQTVLIFGGQKDAKTFFEDAFTLSTSNVY